MRTSVIGYPRIGSLRELKFAVEKYFKKELCEQELNDIASDLRKRHWNMQKEQGIDFIPSNDFSLYDTMLDTAVALNVIPKRYQQLSLSPIECYFAMARGYQGLYGEDVKALAMKKWFHTNYHYMVPEIEDETQITYVGTKLFDEYKEASACGIDTKPVLIGPYTFLKLTRYKGKRQLQDVLPDIVRAYIDILRKSNIENIIWMQLDEPYLVHDMSSKDKALFLTIYQELLQQKGDVKLLLQTYFGDIQDVYEEIIQLPFDGIGLDFVEGKQSLQLVKNFGFPDGKVLFAGVVNGKNIWKNNYAKTFELMKILQSSTKELVLSTSCSLLHVPYTLEHETALHDTYKQHFAFAQEKLKELAELKDILSAGEMTYNACSEDQEHVRCHDRKDEVRQRIAALGEDEFNRYPSRKERAVCQRKALSLPLFPTTTIGSFPQTKEIKVMRSKYKRHDVSAEAYDVFIKEKIKECITLQEKLDIDVLVHGEFERNDMVEYFGEALQGFLFTEKAWVQSYGTRCVKPPIIWGDVARNEPISVAYTTYAQSLTTRPVKGMLTGPVTILNWSFPREDISQKESVMQIALAIRDEVLDLEAHGISIIQIDEAALREKLPLRKSEWHSEYLDWAIAAFRLVHSGVKAETQIHTHMCYSEFEDIIKDIDAMDADVISFEASRSDLTIIEALKRNAFQTQVGPGVYDIHSPRIPSVHEIETAISEMLKKLDIDKLWVNPDCGLKTRGDIETVASLQHMVAAVKNMRKKYK